MKTVMYGDTGTEVYILQSALSRAGFLNETPDGIFGDRTLSAVRRFQQQNGLTVDGIAGPNTWAALDRYIKGYTTHRVVRGDTFYSLSREYSTTPQAIAAANPNASPANLRIGSTLTIPYAFDTVMTDVPYTSQLNSKMIEGLKARYPFIRTGSIGSSVMGKPLSYLAIGTGNKELFISATHHANEWITTPTVLKFFEEYANAVAFGKPFYSYDLSRLYNDTTLYLVPMVDPDGVDLVNEVLTSGSYYENARRIAQNFPAIPFPDGWKANIAGTDLNLQYPAAWQQAKEIKFAQGFTSPAPRDFVGTAPLSAPESRAVYKFTRNHNFRLILAYHTQGSIIYWRYKDLLPPDSFEIGKLLSDASGYPLLTTPDESGSAGYKDWFILEYNRPGYTVEAGLGTNPLPISQFPEIYRANGPLMAQALQVVSEM